IIGAGGAILGLAGLVLASSRKSRFGMIAMPAVALLLCLAAAVLGFTGQPSQIWLPVLVLGGVCSVFFVCRLPAVARAGGATCKLLKNPQLQWGSLLVGCPLWVALAAFQAKDDLQIFDPGSVELDRATHALHEVSDMEAYTDRGTRIPVYMGPSND